MTGTHDRDLTARLAELEATVRGLTQELVSANERIRQLETALEAAAEDGATKVSPDAGEAGTEAAPDDGDAAKNDLGDIIVA